MVPLMSVPTLLGIDVGLSFIAPTTGICRTRADGEDFVLSHVYADRASRLAALGHSDAARSIDLVAIDGPLLPQLRPATRRRGCERVFVCNPFQRRCKPGESHVRGTGRALNRAASDTAGHLAGSTSEKGVPTSFPRVVTGNVVEAFPNAFLGVLLPDDAFPQIPRMRGRKFDALFDAAKARNSMLALLDDLDWPDPALRDALATNRQHDERAALVCAVTAVCVWRGRYTAVGDDDGGWFFLPPWEHWQPWAQRAIEQAAIDVWRDGRLAQAAGGPSR